jgi:hypothetical protein
MVIKFVRHWWKSDTYQAANELTTIHLCFLIKLSLIRKMLQTKVVYLNNICMLKCNRLLKVELLMIKSKINLRIAKVKLKSKVIPITGLGGV